MKKTVGYTSSSFNSVFINQVKIQHFVHINLQNNTYSLAWLLIKYIHYFIDDEGEKKGIDDEEEEFKSLKGSISAIKHKWKKIKRLELMKETFGNNF